MSEVSNCLFNPWNRARCCRCLRTQGITVRTMVTTPSSHRT